MFGNGYRINLYLLGYISLLSWDRNSGFSFMPILSFQQISGELLESPNACPSKR